jgi:hypothetical protein
MSAAHALVEELPFFAPSTEGALDGLLAKRETMRARIEAVAAALDGDAMGHYLGGVVARRGVGRGRETELRVDELFCVPNAVAHLDAALWQQAMAMTDVLSLMPQKRREEWHEQIRQNTTPAFTADNVIPTFEALLHSRSQFFAERVDGIFQALSRNHVTNQPEGFGKRMILNYAWRGCYADHDRAGYINDLRAVVAKFMGREEPHWNATGEVIRIAAGNSGKWMTLDGGALRIRVYKGVGTAHLEVHPDMAWRLNAVLASLHPQAIPAKFRERPARERKAKDFALMSDLLPFQVIAQLAAMRQAREHTGERDRDGHYRMRNVPNALEFDYGDFDAGVRGRAEEALAQLGGVKIGRAWHFDYEPDPVLNEVICSGAIPDRKSHQFYPTPSWLAERVIAEAEIPETLDGGCMFPVVLEPSAGLGALADKCPNPVTVTCVEVSELHCRVLGGKGYNTVNADFLEWAPGCRARFDRIVMNPPFAGGRAAMHLEAAAGLLAPGGRLVAILPSSMRGKNVLPGMSVQWSEVIENAFPDASVNVVIATVERPA